MGLKVGGRGGAGHGREMHRRPDPLPPPSTAPQDEFAAARAWVASSLSFAHGGSVSVFEVTIRELGGLLAAFDLSGDRVFLDKARRLGGSGGSFAPLQLL